MRIIGGSASYRGIIFESDTNVVNAKRIGKDIFISNRRKDKGFDS